MTKIVVCRTHGEQRETFVCEHIVETLHDRRPRGFFWAGGDGDGDECAWCAECEEKRIAAGEEWTDELTDDMGIALLCGSCFDTAKRINGVFH